MTVGIVKKSMPAAQLIWLRRKVGQVCEGGLLRRGMYLATVDWATAMPSLSNSPWIRGAPQPGFSVAMRRMSVRRSALIEGRPVGRDRQRQKRRKPRRCQRMTVAGRTMASVSRQPGQSFARPTQKARSRAQSRRRGRRRARIASCWRRARFSRTRSAREQNKVRTAAAKARSRANIPIWVAERTGGSKSHRPAARPPAGAQVLPTRVAQGSADGLFSRHRGPD